MIIHRYEISPPTGHLSVELPADAEVLSVGYWKGGISLWVLIDEATVLKRERHFVAIGTAQMFETSPEHFLGTVLMPDHGLAWHIFEV